MNKRNLKVNKGDKKRLSGNAGVFIRAQIIYLILSLAFLLISAFISYSSSLDTKFYFYITVFSIALASFLSSFYSGYKIHKNGLVVGLLFSLPMNIIWLIVSAVINSFKSDATIIISLVVLLIVSMLGGVLAVNTGLKAKKVRKGR